MSSVLCFTVRFLQPYSHGRGDGGEPEWPPSPLRFFQALVAAAAARWNERMRLAYAATALEWLERQPPPAVAAAAGIPSDGKYRLYVPDNVADKVAKSWRGGNPAASIADYRTEKDVRPTHLAGEAVHYLYPLPDDGRQHVGVLEAAARSVTHLGWGVDMVAAHAAAITADDAANLPGERWQPAAGGAGTGLRVPCPGTLADLTRKHEASLGRISDDGFRPVPPLSAFRVVNYRRPGEPVRRPCAAFRIASVDPDSTKNPAFDTTRRTRDVAAWVRHAAQQVCDGWPFDPVASFVHGHNADGSPLSGPDADRRFQFLPLPTINGKLNRVESIRRVLVAAQAGCEAQVEWVRLRLPGQTLVALDDTPMGVLIPLPQLDRVLQQYVGSGSVWSTVTPVILPGHDDRDDRKTAALLRRALAHAGFSDETIGGPASLEWRAVGFRPGLDTARRYVPPEQLVSPRYHVRVAFPRPVFGPLAIGAGRYRGFGVFARESGSPPATTPDTL